MGKYLSRTVKVSDVPPSQTLELDDLGNSVVLVVLGRALPGEAMRALLTALIAQSPLAIALFGINARVAFDRLIANLSDGIQRPHIMTQLLEDDEVDAAVEGLLQATWPSDERFDDWTDYAIVNLGGDIKRIERTVERLCD
ncbi:MAG: hypothetical protein AB7F74_27475 [Parvibaculaceae bacterium]